MTYHRFAAAEAALADEWFTEIETTKAWTLGAPVGQGEAGSFHVTSIDGLRGVAKPTNSRNDNIPRAAHEKIAADLAWQIGIPVPAVTLWKQPSTGTLFSISAWAFAQTITWREARSHGIVTEQFIKGALSQITAGTVFHTWIDNTDRHDSNVLVDVKTHPSAPAIAFIDNAYAMSHVWNAQRCPIAVASPHFCGNPTLDQSVINNVVAAISALPEASISDIVRRVPDVYLSLSRKEFILGNLIYRRTVLARLFGSHLGAAS